MPGHQDRAADLRAAAKVPLYHTVGTFVNRQFAQKTSSEYPEILCIFKIDILKKIRYNKLTKKKGEHKMATIFFDMDGTIADLYGVENWLDYLIASDALPYEIAKPLVRLNSLARILNRLQKQGYRIGIISWLSKNSTPAYDREVTEAKIEWLNKHLASVKFDEIHIVKYGTPKQTFAKTENDILFDDEERNRTDWTGKAFDVNDILKNLKGM